MPHSPPWHPSGPLAGTWITGAGLCPQGLLLSTKSRELPTRATGTTMNLTCAVLGQGSPVARTIGTTVVTWAANRYTGTIDRSPYKHLQEQGGTQGSWGLGVKSLP